MLDRTAVKGGLYENRIRDFHPAFLLQNMNHVVFSGAVHAYACGCPV